MGFKPMSSVLSLAGSRLGVISIYTLNVKIVTSCVYDKDHTCMSALWIKNTSKSDPRSYEVT